MRTKELAKFILERDAIRVKKEAGVPRAKWTKDPILGIYRFCNVHREDDRVTKWIADNWRDEGGYVDIWFGMVFARLFNLPATLHAIGRADVMNWKPDKVRGALKKLRERGPIFNGAYIVSTNGKAMDKVDYLIDLVLCPLWVNRKVLRPLPGKTLAAYHRLLMGYDGMGSFMAGQVVADLKYVEPMKNAPDWWTWAASGPGSRRGLNRVFGYETSAPWNEAAWLQHLSMLHTSIRPLLKNLSGGDIHAQDLQNCLCEYDKYERARLGEGRPKQIYKERSL